MVLVKERFILFVYGYRGRRVLGFYPSRGTGIVAKTHRDPILLI